MSGPAPADGGLEAAERLAAALAEAGGGSVRVVLLYGSQLLGTRRDAHSAYDFVVIVEAYATFYAGLRKAGELPRPVWLMSWMARVLPPNVIAFTPDEGRAGIAKSLIVSRPHFERALGSRPPDHFLLARMVQRVRPVWYRTAEDRAWAESQLAGARARVLTWMAPWLEGDFDAARLGRRLLEVCYRGELRPEAQDRAETIFQAQAEHFREAFPEVLEQGARAGVLEHVGGAGADAEYRLAHSVTAPERKRWRRHFSRSKARTTARWLKHMVTFANWLPYIVRKVERHTGRPIQLTTLERKLPLVFLWPRAIHVLLTRPRGDVDESHETEAHQ